jgi:hypothetical protein
LQQTPSTQLFMAQSLFDVQAWPLGRPTHAPPMQMRLPLQVVLSPALPVVMHAWLPLVHVKTPTVQTAFEQAPPATQLVQLPPLHTWFAPQTVPFAFM